METKTKILLTKQEIKQLIRSCKKTGYCCFDFETNAEPIYNKSFKPTILSISFQPGTACSIVLDHFQRKEYMIEYSIKWAIQKIGHNLIEDETIVKCAWNLKFDAQIFMRYNIFYRGTCIDGMLAKYILNEEKPNDLKSMVRRYIPESGDYEKADNFDKIPWDKKELKPLCHYGGQDTDYTLRLCIFFEQKLISLGLYDLFRNLIMSASRVLTTVERNGLYLDRDFNDKLLEEYKIKIDEALDKVFNLPKVKKFTRKYQQLKIEKYIKSLQDEIDVLMEDVGTNARKISSREQKITNIRAGIFTTKKEQSLIAPINLGSSVDLPELIYGDNGFRFKCTEFTDKGKPSTSEDTLKALRLTVNDPESPKAVFLDTLMDLRGLEKMYTTFIEGWHDKVQDDNKLHGQFKIIGTTSGRLSSAEPNLQQIPKVSVDPNIKKQLIARPGTLYLSSDFSQAELRIMAHLSKDETYLRSFNNGEDPHLAIACQKYHVDYNEILPIYKDEQHPEHKIWSVRRKQAKQLAFGLIYGIGPGLLAEKLSDPKAGIIVSKEEAKKQMDEYFEEHPALERFKSRQEKSLRKRGFLTSLFGRKRRLPQIYSENTDEEAYAIRLGLNFPCQSAASDMCLFGSILIYYLMRQGKLPKMDSVTLVHDANYMNTLPENINVWSLYSMWEIFRNPSTKKYFGFQIKDITMDMDYHVGRTMAEELPIIPGYDYRKMLDPNFSVDEYMAEYKRVGEIPIQDYPKLFPDEMIYFREQFKLGKYGK